MTSKTKRKGAAKASGYDPEVIAALKPVPRRQPAGRLSEPTRAERAEEALRPVAERRCRAEGLPPTPENLARVVRQDHGDPLHAAARLGWIDREHVTAGVQWGEQRAHAAAVWGVGRLAPTCVSLEAAMVGGPLGRSVSDPDPAKAAALWRADAAAWSALGAAGEHARAECVAVVLMMSPVVNRHDLRAGLDALRAHFGL